ncbi:hypothetical protein [Halostella litorea]|uniref:hypothetical protein n=1 Tax=Halostella litorea TaxID=2528831 RepID=UPI00109274E9|nr:hypothetical protein [Halostella litorea]
MTDENPDTVTVEIDTTVADSIDLSNIGMVDVGDAAVEVVGEPDSAGTLPETVRVTGELRIEREDGETA